jgi:hypothetical protein
MPRVLSVAEVRNALYWAAGGPDSAGEGAPSSALFGTLFHQVFRALTGPEGEANLVRPLERADATAAAWRDALIEHTYAWHVAPALVHHQSRLKDRANEVLQFWEAVQHLCGWLAEVMWEQRGTGRPVAEARESVFIHNEEDASFELSDPSWSDSVLVQGRIDAVLRQPSTSTDCLVELKTGRGAPEADLAQALMYRMLRPQQGSQAHVAVVGFGPQPKEHRFDAAQTADAESALRALVGRLADVAPGVGGSNRGTTPQATTSPSVASGGYNELRTALADAFDEFRVALTIEEEPLVGPTFLRFFATPGQGVRMGPLRSLADSVWTRILTEQPPHVSISRGRVTIDVQRPDRQTVRWSDIRSQLPARTPEGSSRFPVGVAVDGTLAWADFANPEHSHFLAAGTAGSGKSEWLRATIASLLATNDPTTLRLVLIDPKRTAFGAFEGADCLWRPVVYPSDTDVRGVLDELITEMEKRYRRLAEARVQDLAGYNAAGSERLARIVCLCDEYADLLADRKTRRDVELRIGRLASKSRAAGIHLVFATQKPSRDIVQGVIDANLMARVALKVNKKSDSQIIISHPGAAALLGRGDLLFRAVGDPVRLQSPLATAADLRGLLP